MKQFDNEYKAILDGKRIIKPIHADAAGLLKFSNK